MKLLLIREKNTSILNSNLSLGIATIGTLAKSHATVKIIDNNSFYKTYSVREFLKEISDYQPDIIGFNVNILNAYRTWQTILKIKKKFPGICIIGGGIHAFTRAPELVELGFHVVARGEADTTIGLMLSALKEHVSFNHSSFKITEKLKQKLTMIPGIVFSGEKNHQQLVDTGMPKLLRDLDELPYIDYNLFNMNDFIKNKYDKRYVSGSLETQRGCPFKCPFCQLENGLGLSDVRENSPAYMVGYIKYLSENFGVKHFEFQDNNFTLKRKKTLEFCNDLIEENLNEGISFSIITNTVRRFDDELLAALKLAGCVKINLGVERLSQDSPKMKGMKNNRPVVVEYNLEALKRHDIKAEINCIIGFPYETVSLLESEIKEFLRISDHFRKLNVNIFLPIPGTDYFENAGDKKWYLRPYLMKYTPSYYHSVFFYSNVFWHMNTFNFDKKLLAKMSYTKEFFMKHNIKKVTSRKMYFVYLLNVVLAKISWAIYKFSPRLENILFFTFSYVKDRLWNFVVVNSYEKGMKKDFSFENKKKENLSYQMAKELSCEKEEKKYLA